jgi:Uncharacterised protein family (UPF0158).
MQEITLSAIADKLEKIDLWKIYFDTQTGAFVEFSEEYDAASQEQTEEEILQQVFEVEDNWQRYVPLPSAYDVDEHAIMRKFAEQQAEALRQSLQETLQGSGAIRHFARKVRELALTESWQAYYRQELLQIAADWCLENGIDCQG